MTHTLPPGWEEKTLGEVCSILNGLWSGKKEPFCEARVLRNTNFTKDCKLDFSDVACLKVEQRQFSSRELKQGDLLLEKSGGGPKQPVGRIVLFDKDEKGFSFSNFTSVLRVKDKKHMTPHFLHWFLYFCYLSGVTISMQKHTTGIRNLQMNEYKNIVIPIPSLLEQKRIVEKLDKIFAAIDKAKSQTEKNLQNTKEIFQRQLDKVLFPRTSWKKLPLSGVCDVRDGTHDSPQYIKEGFPLVTSKNLKHGKLSFDNVKYISRIDYEHINERSKVDIGDVLFAMIGTIGNPVVVTQQPHYAIKNVALFKHSNEILPIFLKYFLSSNMVIEKMQKEANGTTQKFVSLGYLRKFPIFLPSISEQQEIISQLDSLNSKTQELEKIYTQKLADLEELKQAVLQQAFNGKL